MDKSEVEARSLYKKAGREQLKAFLVVLLTISVISFFVREALFIMIPVMWLMTHRSVKKTPCPDCGEEFGIGTSMFGTPAVPANCVNCGVKAV